MEKEGLIKIAVIGAESTGKSWLCVELSRYFNASWVPEHARSHFEKADIENYTQDDLVEIAKKQIEIESEAVKKARRIIFMDTSLITIKVWAELEFGKTPDFIEQQLKGSKYNYYLIMDNAHPWVKDNLRKNKFNREIILEMNVKEVMRSKTPYALITGTGAKRLQNAIQVVETLIGA